MKIVIAKGSIAFGAFPLPRVVPGLQTLKTEHVETFGQDGVLLARVTAWTSQLRLKTTIKGSDVIINEAEVWCSTLMVSASFF